jgi:hypothetical protein
VPLLDVSDLLLDPDFSEELTIQRRADTVGDNGRTSKGSIQIVPRPYGVVLPKDTWIGGNELERQPEGQFRGAALTVHSQFRFRSTAQGFQPDILIWNGDPYVCTLVNNYSHYGQGFTEAEFTSISTNDEPPA